MRTVLIALAKFIGVLAGMAVVATLIASLLPVVFAGAVVGLLIIIFCLCWEHTKENN